MNISAEDLIPVPTIERFCPRIPELKNAIQVTHHNGFGSEVEQIRALSQLLLALSQFRRSFEDTLFQFTIQQFQLACLSVQLGEHTDFSSQ